MDIALQLVSGLVECVCLVLAVEAARAGRVIYWGAVAGLALVLYARMADGYLAGAVTLGPLHLTPSSLLTVVGLVIAALTVLGDLMFEIVDEPQEAAGPSV
jgi:uncharacterized membrane protein